MAESIEAARVTRPLETASWRDNFAHKLWMETGDAFDCYSQFVGDPQAIVLLGTGVQANMHLNTRLFTTLRPGVLSDYLEEHLPDSCRESRQFKLGKLGIQKFVEEEGDILCLVAQVTDRIIIAENMAIRGLVERAVGCKLPWPNHLYGTVKLAEYVGRQRHWDFAKFKPLLPTFVQARSAMVEPATVEILGDE